MSNFHKQLNYNNSITKLNWLEPNETKNISIFNLTIDEFGIEWTQPISITIISPHISGIYCCQYLFIFNKLFNQSRKKYFHSKYVRNNNRYIDINIMGACLCIKIAIKL